MKESGRRGARWLRRVTADPRVQTALGLVAVALAIAVGVQWGRRNRTPRPRTREEPPPLPEAHAIWDSWRAAWRGDVDRYLACFAKDARERLEAELRAKGREAFARGLRDKASAALAIELGRPTERSTESLVFPVIVQREQDAERLDYRVVQEDAHWRIADRVSRGITTATPPYAERLAPPAQQGEQ